MKTLHIFILFLSCSVAVFSQKTQQIRELNSLGGNVNDSISKLLNRNTTDSTLTLYKPKFVDKKYFKINKDTLVIDTALTITNYYKFNPIGKDNFNKITFSNIGHTLNELTYVDRQNSILPQLGVYAKQNRYVPKEEVAYFDTTTPIGEFIYQSGRKEGQLLKALFTYSPSKRFNIALRYNGLRSLGRYSEELSSNNQFITSLRFNLPKERYRAWLHFASQSFKNEENGGIKNPTDFTSGVSEFRNRNQIITNLEDIHTSFLSKRFVYGHQLDIVKPIKNDSVHKGLHLFLENNMAYEKQKFMYNENDYSGVVTYWGFTNLENGFRKINERHGTTINTDLRLKAKYKNNQHLGIGLSYDQLKVNLDSTLITNNNITIPKITTYKGYSALASYRANYKFIDINSDVKYTVRGELKESYLFNTNINVNLFPKFKLFGTLKMTKTRPTQNQLLAQNFYEELNYNNENFKNIETQNLSVGIANKKWGRLEIGTHRLNNYTYYNSNFLPEQYEDKINNNYIKLRNHFSFKNIHLENTFQYQIQSEESKQILPLPDFITRNSLYYQGKVFKRNMDYQIGVNFKYFDSFKSREYNPVLGAFNNQSTDENFNIGSYPRFDFFINMKVKRMRIYLNVENFTSDFTGFNYWSAPLYPNSDWLIKVGIHWYMFT